MRGFFDWTNRIHFIWRWLVTQGWYKIGFGGMGARTVFLGQVSHHNARGIEIGPKVIIGPHCRLECFIRPSSVLPLLSIQTGVNIQHNVNIYAAEKLVIEKNVLIASGCMITDNNHGTQPDQSPYVCQPLSSSPTIIEEGVWLGEHVCVLAGSCVGRYSVIGSNSVVVGEIPAYSMAVGSPARVIKRFDSGTKQWVRVSN